MKGTLITYLFQFLSSLIIVLILIFSLQIIRFIVFKKDYINSKLGSETLASIISSVSSSTFNISLEIPTQQKYKIDIKDNEINVSLDNDSHSSQIIIPDYVSLKETSFFVSEKIKIEKIGDKVEIS
jgi:hypothetical protein